MKILKHLRSDWFRYGFETIEVVGILVAFALDNWNEERQNRKEEQLILIGLKEEFLKNLNDVNRNIILNEGVIEATYDMMDLLRSENRFGNQDLIDSLITRIYMFGTFDAHTGKTEEIINTGKVTLLKDAKLWTLLTGWSGVLQNAQE